MFRRFFLLILIPFFLHARKAVLPEEEPVTPPWFTGPLLASSSTVIPAGHWNTEPYFFAIKAPASYNEDWTPQNQPTSWVLSAQIPVWIGLTNWSDILIQPTASWNHKPGAGGSWTFNDFLVQMEFQLHLDELPHKSWWPSIKLAFREVIPTGNYRNLNPQKLSIDAGGTGSWVTGIQLVFGKLIQLSRVYYLNSRLSMLYSISAPVHIKGFNAYGGGYGANGTVYPGQNFQLDLAFEVSLSRHWAFALDVLGVWQGSSRFSGYPGVMPVGSATVSNSPSNGSLASDGVSTFVQYSLAPGLEYNFNESLGIIAGTWFTIAGKNVSEFYSAIFAINYYK